MLVVVRQRTRTDPDLLLCPATFWDALGGRQDVPPSPRDTDLMDSHPPRLFACSNSTGTFLVRRYASHMTAGRQLRLSVSRLTTSDLFR